jgi:hypothetical protein
MRHGVPVPPDMFGIAPGHWRENRAGAVGGRSLKSAPDSTGHAVPSAPLEWCLFYFGFARGIVQLQKKSLF